MRLQKPALVLLPKVVIIAIRIKENRSLHQELSLNKTAVIKSHLFAYCNN